MRHVLVLMLLSACTAKPSVAPAQPSVSDVRRPPPSRGWVDRREAEGAPADPDERVERLDKATIRELVGAKMGEVRKCYLAALVRSSSTRGRLLLRFAVTPAGEVTNARAEASGFSDAALEICVVGVVQGIAFPASAAARPITIAYPIVLDSGGAISATDPEYEDVARVFRPSFGVAVDACFEKRRRARETVFLDFDVGPAGHPTNVHVTGLPPASVLLERCIEQNVEMVDMPPPEGGATVRVTVELYS